MESGRTPAASPSTSVQVRDSFADPLHVVGMVRGVGLPLICASLWLRTLTPPPPLSPASLYPRQPSNPRPDAYLASPRAAQRAQSDICRSRQRRRPVGPFRRLKPGEWGRGRPLNTQRSDIARRTVSSAGSKEVHAKQDESRYVAFDLFRMGLRCPYSDGHPMLTTTSCIAYSSRRRRRSSG